MFGEKGERNRRLLKIRNILEGEKQGISQAELARRLGVSRATALKDLSIVQERTGILVAEDGQGRLTLFGGS